MPRRHKTYLVVVAALAALASACADDVPIEALEPPAEPSTPTAEISIRDDSPATWRAEPLPAMPTDTCPFEGANDSDGDGLADVEETHTDPCLTDTDLDGVDDLIETVWSDVRCGTSPSDCDCARQSTCQPASDLLAVVLPEHDTRTVTFDVDSTIDRADVFFLVDDSASMAAPYVMLREALLSGRLIGQIARVLPDLEVGIGWEEGFVFAPGAAGADAPFVLGETVSSDWEHKLPGAFGLRWVRDGGDPIASHAVALEQVLTGAGGTFTSTLGNAQTLPAYGTACGAGRFGAACFRDTAVPVVAHVTDTASGDDLLASPVPSADRLAGVLRGSDVRYVGVNASGVPCSVDGGACADLKSLSTAATGSVLVELPSNVDEASSEIAHAITHAVTRFPVDVSARARPVDLAGGTAPFVTAIRARCEGPSVALCDVGAPGTTADATSLRTMPGTAIKFEVSLRNDDQPSAARSQRWGIRLDSVVGRASAESRYLYVIVPASR